MTETMIYTTCSNCRRDVRIDLLEGTVNIEGSKNLFYGDDDLVQWDCICTMDGEPYADSYDLTQEEEET